MSSKNEKNSHLPVKQTDSGCYQLKINVKKTASIEIGALGLCRFERGIYIYTGSAMKNLSKRVARHRRNEKKLRWHIDYLLSHPSVIIVEVTIHPSANKEECLHNQLLIKQGAKPLIKGFGSSDCRACPSHLLKIGAD